MRKPPAPVEGQAAQNQQLDDEGVGTPISSVSASPKQAPQHLAERIEAARLGWSIHVALTTPVHSQFRRRAA
jgi:hypothetical protein